MLFYRVAHWLWVRNWLLLAVGEPPADFGTVHFHSIIVTDSAGVSGGLVSLSWNTDKMVQPSALNPRTAAGLLPSPYTAFADAWVP